MFVTRWAVKLHRWIALVIGVQITLWITGGLVMSAIPIEIVRGEHKVRVTPAATVDLERLLDLDEVVAKSGLASVQSATLSQLLDQPVWRLTSPRGEPLLVDATTGDRLDPLPRVTALAIAQADYGGDGPLVAADLLLEPPHEAGGAGPRWRVSFDDGDNTTLYVDPSSGRVTARRSRTWRFYDFFWRLHVMDYDDGASFNHPLIIAAAGTALFVALSGLVLLVVRTRRSVALWWLRR